MLHYEAKGAGKNVLVCLHGFLESAAMWLDLGLENYAKLILIDLPGHGKSPTKGIDSMKTMAEEVRLVLDKTGITRYDVIGHSMGGYVALELEQLDNRCGNLILLNSNVWSDSKQKKRDRQRVAQLVKTKKDRFVSEAIPNLFEHPEDHKDIVKELVRTASQMSAEAIGRASLAMSQRTDYSEDVFSGNLPVTIIQGRNDTVVDVHRMEKIMAHHEDRFFLLDTGHMAHVEKKASLKEVLHKILPKQH